MTAGTLYFPALTPKRVRIRPSLFRERSGRAAVFALNAAERGGALLSTGGRRLIEQLPAGCERLFRTEDGVRFFWDGTALYKGEDSFSLSSPPLDVLSFVGETGREYCALTASGLYLLGAEGAEAVEGAPTGGAMALHGERLFIASGETLSYSAPLMPADWTISADGAGEIVLPSAGGAIQRLLSHRGRLLCFRERGITALTAPGDFLDFKAEEIPCAFGSLIASSVAACGSRILFCTEEGIFSLKGEAVTAVEGCGEGLVDFTKGVRAASAGESYYAALTLLSGERCILSLAGERAALLRLEADDVLGGKQFFFLQGGRLYALDEKGAGEREMLLEFPLSDFGLAEIRYLDGVRVEGEGSFRLEVRPARGLPRFVRGRAGEDIRLSPPLKGSAFALRVRSSGRAKLGSLILRLREGKE